MNIGKIIEELLCIACNLLDELPNTLTVIPELDEQEEDKHLICDLLAVTLQATRGASDLISLEFDDEAETVTAHFTGGGVRRINVACDSGVAMIRDIMEHLGV